MFWVNWNDEKEKRWTWAPLTRLVSKALVKQAHLVVFLDLKPRGQADVYVEGVDRNRDGIPDILQQECCNAGGGKRLVVV